MVSRRWYVSLQWVLAGLLAVSLPFTSFPLVARITGSSMVAPLALLPMLGLLVFWLFPYLGRSGKLPKQTLPLLIFALAAVISTLAAFFLKVPPYKSASLLRSGLEGMLTLAVGLCFYLVVTAWAGSADRLRFFFRMINWGGLLLIAWSLFQAFVWFARHSYPDWMWNFQGQMCTSLLLYVQRTTGFAYEPSWLAHQLNMLYLPFWLASVFSGFTAHRLRVWKITFEHILLLGGVAVLALSVSRIGWLTFLAMVGLLMLLLNIRWARSLMKHLFRRADSAARKTRLLKIGFTILWVLVSFAVYAGLIVAAGYVLSKVDTRMARLFDLSLIREQSFFHWANHLVFAERIVFWQAGWEIFNDLPLLGTGLGNSGYFFPQELSAFSWALTEIRILMYQWTALPNIKSLWVRLLAETGIVGFGLFISWLYVLWHSAVFLRAQNNRLQQMVGLAGSFMLVAFMLEGFSLDTFALPYYWITFGLVTAACGMAMSSRREPHSPDIDPAGS